MRRWGGFPTHVRELPVVVWEQGRHMPRTFSRLIALVGVCLLLSAIPAGALGNWGPLEPENPLPSAEDGQMTNESSNLWFVQLKSKPTINGTNPSTIAQEQNAFRGNAAKAKLQYTERFAYSSLFNGIAMEINPAQAGELSRIAGVTAAFPIIPIAVPETEPISPELATALQFTIQAGLQQWLGDLIEVKNLVVASDDAELRIEVQYVVTRTQQTVNRTFSRSIA